MRRCSCLIESCSKNGTSGTAKGVGNIHGIRARVPALVELKHLLSRPGEFKFQIVHLFLLCTRHRVTQLGSTELSTMSFMISLNYLFASSMSRTQNLNPLQNRCKSPVLLHISPVSHPSGFGQNFKWGYCTPIPPLLLFCNSPSPNHLCSVSNSVKANK